MGPPERLIGSLYIYLRAAGRRAGPEVFPKPPKPPPSLPQASAKPPQCLPKASQSLPRASQSIPKHPPSSHKSPKAFPKLILAKILFSLLSFHRSKQVHRAKCALNSKN